MHNRGKIHFDANDNRGPKKKMINADLHINKNHNIFEDGYTSNTGQDYIG